MMKRTLVALMVLFAGLVGLSPAVAQTPPTDASLLVKLVAGLAPETQTAVVARNGGIEVSSVPALRLHVVVVSAADLAAVKALYQGDPLVEHVEENLVRASEAIPSDPLYASQWVLPQIGWDQVFGVVDVRDTATVAILDTGVDALHPDLAGVVVPGTSIVDGSSGTVDPHGHGTGVAGIVAARTNTTPMEGVAGVAYAGVRIMPVTVLNADGLGMDSDVIAGLIWAVDHGADVILMAFSNAGFSRNLQDAIDYAWARGVVIVAAAGNSASSEPTFPAGDRGVMGVGATDSADRPAAFSNSGPAVFIAAPGVDVATTAIGDGYDAMSGTSAASAIVAGAAGLMKAQDRSLSNGVIVGRLARNADPAGTQVETGNGRVNLARAMADTSTAFVQPAGAAPVGDGGPFVGPYAIDSVSTVTITAPTSAVNLSSGSLPAAVSVSFSYSTSDAGTTTATVEVLGTTGSATQFVASGSGKSATIPVTVPAGASVGSHNIKVTVLNSAGTGSNQKNDQKNGVVVIVGDTTPPSITPSVSGTAGANGWYTGDVTVSWIVSDPESAVASQTGCDPVVLTTETTGTTLTCSATSGGGTASASVTIKLDKTPPTAALTVTEGTAGLNGWYTSDVTVVANGSDNVSAPVVCTPARTVSTETAGTTVDGTCTNDAGLTATATLMVKLDKTPPTATLTVSVGTAGANGWYTSDVTVHTGGADTVSSPVSCTADQSQTTETAGAVFNGSCTNDAGLTAQAAPLTVKLDKTPPTAALAVVAGTAGANGWYTSDVTVRTSGDDALSGPVTCTADQVQATETAGTVFNGSCTNKAGLSAGASTLAVKLDKTPPTITIDSSVEDGGSYYFGYVPAAGTCAATDVTSGTATPPGCVVSGYDGSVGHHTLTATAGDNAGNSATRTRSYTVLAWTLRGFYQPVEMGGVWNAVKGGSTVPLKFEVFAGPMELTDTSIVALAAARVACSAGNDDPIPLEMLATGGTSLRYDAVGGQFIFNWQTPRVAGQCYRVTLTTLDGSTLSTLFKTK